ncbi:MAG TPA: RHS repeat-associated core domain-containing protein, partial [Anaerolineae bacterium]|nr:RHS repeat-associated core domain-containing protein [Anaerolineae bacterium]HNU06101.1 RHS repeat-associated core domain-containing protein [Anaerolineae bacterium]
MSTLSYETDTSYDAADLVRSMTYPADGGGREIVTTAYLFTGQRFDYKTDLYYYGARFYDGVLGRFIQPDTIVPDPG